MQSPNPTVIESTLAPYDVHAAWESVYRTPAAVRMQDRLVHQVAELLGAGPGTEVLDAGCGSGANTVRLARLGARVRAVDFSESVLEQTRRAVREAGVEQLVTVGREDLTALSLPDDSADRVLCWGVLMHVPAIERAVGELSRVLAPGGTLVVCEGNVRAPDELALRVLDRLGRTTSSVRTPSGQERWRETSAGPLLARRTDQRWLIRAFEDRGLTLRAHLPCLFTEAFVYTRPGSLGERLVHGVNDVWARAVRSPRLASDTFLVFEKPAG
jgi:SAM-dependent methyltransferase